MSKQAIQYAMALGFALSAILLGAALAHAEHSAYESVVCRTADGAIVRIDEEVDIQNENLRVRPEAYIRVARATGDVVYFGIGPLWCEAIRSTPPE